ncbi:hypothetical protein EYF80_052331 [Liparis tanakae]|uniref:Uncharacterized protein n=1 Tax=Liparis tanakae TaxID=230148 RepID=A0A4Z2F8G7_9TELE|nr:hypothetical protein EYF80_052331 [Liparis tanakae]
MRPVERGRARRVSEVKGHLSRTAQPNVICIPSGGGGGGTVSSGSRASLHTEPPAENKEPLRRQGHAHEG